MLTSVTRMQNKFSNNHKYYFVKLFNTEGECILKGSVMAQIGATVGFYILHLCIHMKYLYSVYNTCAPLCFTTLWRTYKCVRWLS